MPLHLLRLLLLWAPGQVVWFELKGTETDFSARMRTRADRSVVLGGGLSGQGAPGDPLAAARRSVAGEAVDVLLYLAVGITPFTFLLAQVSVMGCAGGGWGV